MLLQVFFIKSLTVRHPVYHQSKIIIPSEYVMEMIVFFILITICYIVHKQMISFHISFHLTAYIFN